MGFEDLEEFLIVIVIQLISSVDPKFLKLTKMDDDIYSAFRETFEDLDIKVLHPDQLKTVEAKEVDHVYSLGWLTAIS